MVFWLTTDHWDLCNRSEFPLIHKILIIHRKFIYKLRNVRVLYRALVSPCNDAYYLLLSSLLRLSITASGSPIAGESYTLECSAGGSEGTFQWLGPPDGRTPVVTSGSITISSTSTSSQLQFRPVQQSDNGSYSCSATIDGSALTSGSIAIAINSNAIILNFSLQNLNIEFYYSLSSSP